MSHRFPLHDKVFPPLHLSESTKATFVDMAHQQLTLALHDYDKYRRWQASRPPSLRHQLHPAMWKPVKSCEQLTVYRQVPRDDAVVTIPSSTKPRRTRSRTLDGIDLPPTTSIATTATTDSVSSSASSKKSVTVSSWTIPKRGSNPTATREWLLPTLLQVGAIKGALDDVMYGLTSFDAAGSLIRSSYTDEEVVDADTLHQLQGPTRKEPFRFLGLKWVVRSASSTVKAFIWPRDVTVLASTGVLTRPSGERVGYHLMHSVDLGQGFGPLERKRIVRGQVSSCYLYRQTSTNTVDVHMKTNFEPHGSAHESVAFMFAVNSLTYCLKSAICAQNKKLSWLLARPKTAEPQSGASTRPDKITVKKQRSDCCVCTKPIGPFSRSHTCRVCDARACHTCFVKKKLSFSGSGHKTVEQRSVVICTHCLTHARRLASLDIARQEVTQRERLGRRRGLLHHGTDATSRSRGRRSNSRVNNPGKNRSTRHDDRDELRAAEAERNVRSAPVRRASRPLLRARSLRKVTSSTKAAWDDNADTEDDDDDDEKQSKSNRFADVQPRTKHRSTQSDRGRKIVLEPDVVSPVLEDRELQSLDIDVQAGRSYVVSVQATAAMPMPDDLLPEAVEQYAWGAVVPSPVNYQPVEPQTAWPSPPSSPSSLLSLPEGDRCTGAISQVPQSSIPRIQAGASTQEVLAQFAELCHAADNVYWAAKMHTVDLPEPTLFSKRRISRLDMSAVD
uniref:FYVE-type domain-containing protein n=1 Tax=Peronospora matthiolae TaxID=2874970 RepID=A0AAV1TBJ1_9STRA